MSGSLEAELDRLTAAYRRLRKSQTDLEAKVARHKVRIHELATAWNAENSRFLSAQADLRRMTQERDEWRMAYEQLKLVDLDLLEEK